MNIEISKSEAELIDEALKEWAHAPTMSNMMASILCRGLGGKAGQSEGEIEAKTREDVRKNNAEVAQRERRTLLLRAKIMQAVTRESEHVIEEGGGR